MYVSFESQGHDVFWPMTKSLNRIDPFVLGCFSHRGWTPGEWAGVHTQDSGRRQWNDQRAAHSDTTVGQKPADSGLLTDTLQGCSPCHQDHGDHAWHVSVSLTKRRGAAWKARKRWKPKDKQKRSSQKQAYCRALNYLWKRWRPWESLTTIWLLCLHQPCAYGFSMALCYMLQNVELQRPVLCHQLPSHGWKHV